MLAILNSLNANNFPIVQPILMILVSKFMVHRALSDKTYNVLINRIAVPFKYIQYKYHEIPSNGYLIVSEDGKIIEI